jgi:hypothetical protein
MTNDTRLQIRHFRSYADRYLEILSHLRWPYDLPEDALTVPLVLTCAAALECTLNDAMLSVNLGARKGVTLADWREARDEGGWTLTMTPMSATGNLMDDLADGYLSMSLRGKLTNIVPILTCNRFKINREHKTYQTLVELIRERNRLVHAKGSLEATEATTSMSITGILKLSEDRPLPDRTLDIKAPASRFYDAIQDFHKKFLDEYFCEDYVGNDLILPVELPESHSVLTAGRDEG